MANQPVCIITGAGGGIGRATAVELSRLGYRLALVGRTEATLAETARLLPRDQSLIIRADVTDADEVVSSIQQSLHKFGRIDAVINNAGTAPVLNVEQTAPEVWREVIETNLTGAFLLSRAAWASFKNQKSGVIINISSMAARDPFAGLLAYGAAKAGLNNLGISLAREGAPSNIRVHTIAPGAVETQMLRNILSPQQLPTENTLSPQDVAAVVGSCVIGDLRYTSGEVIWLSRRP